MKRWLRAIFSTRTESRLAIWQELALETAKLAETNMARIDEMDQAVTDIAVAVDAVIAVVNDLHGKLATAGVEDPRIGQAVDNLNATRAKLEAVLPPPEAPPAG